jgi:DNA-directed RNA polymerase specialized sigma subunit
MTTCPPRPPRPRIDAGEHLRLARRIVVEFLRGCPSLRYLEDDLLAGAQLGLCEAAARYNERLGTWGVYAYRYAFGYMMIVLRRHGLRHGRRSEPAPYQIGFDSPESIDDSAIEGQIPNPEAVCEALDEAKQDAATAEWLVSWLSPEEWSVISLRYGLGADEMAPAKVAIAVGITKHDAMRIEKSAIAKMRIASAWRNEWPPTSTS